MVHPHGLSHLVRRQRHRKEEEEDQEIQTVVVTMPNTFTGDVVWITRTDDSESDATTQVGAPVQQTKTLIAPETTSAATTTRKPSSTAKETDSEEETTAKPTSTRSTAVTTPGIATESSFSSVTNIAVASSSTLGALAAATTSVLPSASATAEAASSGGMSGGAKAGLALGILLAIGALLGAILFVYHRKKKQIAQQKVDDEKYAMQNAPPPPPPHVEPAPSIRTNRTMSTAPRLSLRPVTQFDPTFPNRKSGGNLLDVAAAGAPVARSGDRTPSPVERPSSSWERRGAANASAAPVNPFNDPQTRSGSPPQDPFTNSAAIETPHASAPGTPMTAHHNAPRSDFGNPAPAIAAAEAVGDTASLVAALPSPPSIHSNADVPPSPAWTDDIPASPGPAPSGPLPVAAAGATNGPPAAPNNVHRVQLDFKPSMSDELGLHAGQLVRMLHEYDDGWALCVRMDRSQQGVVPRTCLSKHPVKPRQGPPRQGPPGPRMRGPPANPQTGPGVPQPRPLSPASGRNSPHPPSLSPANGRMSPGPRSMSPGPRQMSPPQGRARSNSNAPYTGPPRSMSPGPYGGGPQMAPPPQMSRPRSNSAGQAVARRPSPPGPSPMNPNANLLPMPHRKPLPGQAL
ncbi:hypothetical protein K458DRAFT_440456 [Lentithecium fluviatile CBS 122367]|uniref:SH3 domain-containing protein n=1 Tax=Lentithecium fluviatile CBS 122367 TaxID=1168545 RepID=A0A6G1JB25_9PLEO|nr:hypothetical protein K458DRAFT_440456 [Lentithecium fluviatile CBS 122367]